MTHSQDASPPGPQLGSGPGALRLQAEILESESLPAAHHRLLLRAPQIVPRAQPGQFLHIWCHPPDEIERPPCAAILRRPYSISRLRPPYGVEILLRVRGKGGRLLAAKAAGESLDIIGPLGRGFRISPGLSTAVIVAGGIGLALVPFLIEALVARGVHAQVLAGAADDNNSPFYVDRSEPGGVTIPYLMELGAGAQFVSEYQTGTLLTEFFEQRRAEFSGDATEVFACGPHAMLKRLAEVTGAHIPLQVSLEERMACGLGACRSCVVPAAGQSGYKTVCRDGPVFDAAEIDWERLTP